MRINITWSNVVFWRWHRIWTTSEFKSNVTNSNNLILRKVKLLDVKWSDNKMIYRLIFVVSATLSQLRKKKLCCVSVAITQNNVTCKLKNDDCFEMIYFLSFDGDNFETVASSKCDHTSELANYRGSLMTTGHWSSDCGNKTEIYNVESNQWNDAPDYPYSS